MKLKVITKVARKLRQGLPCKDFNKLPVEPKMVECVGLVKLDLLAAQATGGVIELDLEVGLLHAHRNYLILGSITGTAPGTGAHFLSP